MESTPPLPKIAKFFQIPPYKHTQANYASLKKKFLEFSSDFFSFGSPAFTRESSEIPLAGAKSTYFYRNQFWEIFQNNILFEKVQINE